MSDPDPKIIVHSSFYLGGFHVNSRLDEVTSAEGQRCALSDDAGRLLLALVSAESGRLTFEQLGSRFTRTAFIELQSAFPASGLFLEDDGGIGLNETPELLTTSLWKELSRRKVIRVTSTYAVIAFILLQIGDATFESVPYFSNAMPVLLAVLIVGLPIVVGLAWVYEITPGGLIVDASRTEKRRVLTFERMVIAALFVVSVSIALWLLSSRDAQPARLSNSPTLGVLPFKNFGPNPEDSYIGDGISEELLNVLAQIGKFRVIAQTASFYFKDKDVDFDTIIDRLGAELLVEGSFQKIGDQLHVTAQLIDANGHHLWSQDYTEKVDDVLLIQKRLTRDIAIALSSVVRPEVVEEVTASFTENSAAYRYYLQGKAYLRRTPEERNIDQAERMFRNSLAEDPNYHRARVGLCQSQLARFRQTFDPSDFNTAASNCARIVGLESSPLDSMLALAELNRVATNYQDAARLYMDVLEKDDDSVDALLGLGFCLEKLGDVQEAEARFREGVRIDPAYWLPYRHLGLFLIRQNRIVEAAASFEKAVANAPESATEYINVGLADYLLDNWEGADVAWRKSLELQENPIALYNLATLSYYNGRFSEAASLFERAMALRGENYLYHGKLASTYRYLEDKRHLVEDHYRRAIGLAEHKLAIAPKDAKVLAYLASYYANLGDLDNAQASIARALSTEPENAEVHYFAAIVHKFANDKENALKSLRDASDLGYSKKQIQNDPQFASLLEKRNI